MMRTCVICAEQYPKEGKACPYCGCPADRYSFESFGYPKTLAASYTLVGLKDTGGPAPAVLMEDPNTKERIFAARLPKGEGADFFLQKLMQQQERVYRELPEVYGIYPEEGYYIYEEISGQTIQDLLEHENPLDPQSAGHIMNELNHTFTALWQSGFRYGPISPFSCCITKEGIRLTDFGSDREYADDENAMERMGFRLLEGRWPQPQDASRLAAYAPDELAKGIREPDEMMPDGEDGRTLPEGVARMREAAFAAPKKAGGLRKSVIAALAGGLAVVIVAVVIIVKVLSPAGPGMEEGSGQGEDAAIQIFEEETQTEAARADADDALLEDGLEQGPVPGDGQ